MELTVIGFQGVDQDSVEYGPAALSDGQWLYIPAAKIKQPLSHWQELMGQGLASAVEPCPLHEMWLQEACYLLKIDSASYTLLYDIIEKCTYLIWMQFRKSRQIWSFGNPDSDDVEWVHILFPSLAALNKFCKEAYKAINQEAERLKETAELFKY